MEAKLSATEQDISEIVAEIRETKEELKKCAECDKVIFLQGEITQLREKEKQCKNITLSLSAHFFNSSFVSRISATISEMSCSVALSFASIY